MDETENEILNKLKRGDRIFLKHRSQFGIVVTINVNAIYKTHKLAYRLEEKNSLTYYIRDLKNVVVLSDLTEKELLALCIKYA